MERRTIRRIVGLILILLAFGIIKDGRAGFPVINRIIVTVLSPANFILSAVSGGLHNTSGYFTSKGSLQEENAKLVKENETLRKDNVDLIAMKAENERLTQLLNYKNTHNNLNFVTAKVISKNMGDFRDTILINKGTEDGLKNNMSVVNGAGLVGIIDNAYANASKVLLINSSRSRIGGMNLRGDSRVAGIVNGVAGSDASLEMRNMARDADILPGDTVVTSGYSGHHPAGLIIGTIEEIQKDAGGLTKTATITPSVDFLRLEEVMVVTNFSDFSNLLKNTTSVSTNKGSKGGTAR